MTRGERRQVGVLVLPIIVGLLLIALYPTLFLLVVSGTRSSLGQLFTAWVGWDNYGQVVRDPVFRSSLLLSIEFAVPVSLAELLLGLVLALLIRRVRVGRAARALILLPLMTPPTMVAVAWRLMLAPEGGLLNGVLKALGLIHQPVPFLGSSPLALLSIAAADAWQWTPFVALLLYAALQALPSDVQEAAKVDGAGSWQRFRAITLPMVLPALLAVGLLRLVMAFKMFDLVYMLTYGGPGFDTSVATFLIYRVGLQQFDVGTAAAMTVVFALLVGLVTLPVTLLRDRTVRFAS